MIEDQQAPQKHLEALQQAADQCPDGPRYRALGNSWAVPVARWVGRRINDALVSAKP